MPVTKENGALLEDETNHLWFCSEFCRQQYLRHPRAWNQLHLHRRQCTSHRRVAHFMEVALNDI
jgi:hypothetical protein